MIYAFMRHARACCRLLMPCVGAGWAAALVAQDPPANRAARTLIASQAASQFGVWQPASDGRVTLEDIQVGPGPSLVSGINVLRGIPPRDHWHPYLVVVRGDTVCAAGGFTSPELACLARWVRESQSPQTATLARILAILADENGAVRVFPAAEPEAKEISEAWLRRRPQNWPQDTSLTTPEGDTVVRITMLSQQTRSYEQAWRAFAYDFHFDSSGRLLVWSRRPSELFGVPHPR